MGYSTNIFIFLNLIHVDIDIIPCLYIKNGEQDRHYFYIFSYIKGQNGIALWITKRYHFSVIRFTTKLTSSEVSVSPVN